MPCFLIVESSTCSVALTPEEGASPLRRIAPYSFGVVKAAQARGDLEVLVERGRRALRVHLADVRAGLGDLSRAVHEALE